MDLETPSESQSLSASGVLEPPHARPSHTPASTAEGTDVERQEEAVVQARIMEDDLDSASLDVMTPEEQLISGDPLQGYPNIDLSCASRAGNSPRID